MVKFKTNKVLYTVSSNTGFLIIEEREKDKRNLRAFLYSVSIAIPITHEEEEWEASQTLGKPILLPSQKNIQVSALVAADQNLIH